VIFSSWSTLARIAAVAVMAYLALVLLLRLSGKRTLSTMDPFDFVITTALGSTLAQTALSKDVALVEGLVTFATIIALQHLVSWLSIKQRFVRRMIKSRPALLFYKGEFQKSTMDREHVPDIEILAAVRESGVASLDDVEAVVLEADSGFSVIKRSKTEGDSALRDVDPLTVKRST